MTITAAGPTINAPINTASSNAPTAVAVGKSRAPLTGGRDIEPVAPARPATRG